MDITKEVKTVTEEILKDEALFFSYQSNIAMSIFDEYKRQKKLKKQLNDNDIHQICNDGAKDFLNLWCKL